MPEPVLLAIEPLTKAAFEPFGEVIEIAGAERKLINEGYAERFHALTSADVAAGGGRAILSIFRAKRRPLPLLISMMERHPLGSQAFYPLVPNTWLVVVCEGVERPNPTSLRCYCATGQQGVNYARNTWHHPLLILEPHQDFLIIDREGPGKNLEEVHWDATGDRRLIEV